jgi:hypothetical protein
MITKNVKITIPYRNKVVILLLVIIGTYFKTFQYKLIIVQQHEFIELIIPAKCIRWGKTICSFERRITGAELTLNNYKLLQVEVLSN